jgi:hypothetical protein
MSFHLSLFYFPTGEISRRLVDVHPICKQAECRKLSQRLPNTSGLHQSLQKQKKSHHQILVMAYEPRVGSVERLRENLADFNEKLFKNLYQNRLDGQVTGHVLVQIFLNS